MSMDEIEEMLSRPYQRQHIEEIKAAAEWCRDNDADPVMVLQKLAEAGFYTPAEGWDGEYAD